MVNQYEQQQAAAKIYLARFLLTLADRRGMTHGEKHYVIQTVLMLLANAGSDLGDSQGRTAFNEVTNIEPSDIAF